MKQLAFIAVFITVLTGCSSAQLTTDFTEARPNDKKAIVYLYRLKTAYHSLNPDIPLFYFNDKKVGPLKVGGYYAQEVDPGPLEISFSDPFFGMHLWRSGRKVKINVGAGHSYFVKYEVEMMGFYFDLVPPTYGLKEIQTVKLLKP